ncbi:MAG: hypothetical protein H0X64_07675 [Gemmatimonadaceae bacterium]|nr:hypothetical protein [Gemmatimonadaceae bacterium]
MRRPLARPAQRVLALLTVGALAVALSLGMRLDRSARAPAPLMVHMFPQLELQDARSARSLPTREPTGGHSIVIYVSDRCPHCASELARWDSLLSSDHGRFRDVRVDVIRAPGGDRINHGAAFARRELVDARGDVARALRIDAVPASFVLAGDGTIVERRVGEAGPRTIQKFLATAIQGGSR